MNKECFLKYIQLLKFHQNQIFLDIIFLNQQQIITYMQQLNILEIIIMDIIHVFVNLKIIIGINMMMKKFKKLLIYKKNYKMINLIFFFIKDMIQY